MDNPKIEIKKSHKGKFTEYCKEKGILELLESVRLKDWLVSVKKFELGLNFQEIVEAGID